MWLLLSLHICFNTTVKASIQSFKFLVGSIYHSLGVAHTKLLWRNTPFCSIHINSLLFKSVAARAYHFLNTMTLSPVLLRMNSDRNLYNLKNLAIIQLINWPFRKWVDLALLKLGFIYDILSLVISFISHPKHQISSFSPCSRGRFFLSGYILTDYFIFECV